MNNLDWKGAVWAGIIAGVVFMMLQMIMVPVFLEGPPSGPPRMIAAILMGPDVLPPSADFAFGIFMVAMIIHMILSVVLSVVFAVFISYVTQTMSFGTAIVVGGILGLMLYLVNFYLFTGIFPWFSNARNWVSIFSHIIFGVVAVWSYFKLRNPEAVGAAHQTSTSKN